MTTHKAHMRLLKSLKSSGLSMDQVLAGLARLAWSNSPRRIQGACIGDLHRRSPWGPEQVHPRRLLAELAEEFNSGLC